MADIKNHISLTTSLVSYWDLQESSDGTGAVTRQDLHSNANDLTDTATTASGTGIIGNCAVISAGDNNYLSITDASQTGLDITGDLSVSFWYKENATPGTQSPIFTKHNNTGNQRSYRLDYDASSDIWIFYISNDGAGWSFDSIDLTGVDEMNSTEFHHIVITYDASAGTATMYVNATDRGDFTGLDTSIYDSSAPFGIGGTSVISPSHSGEMDEFGIWSKVLTTSEISDLYNSGSGLPYYDPADIANDTTLSTSLSAYWTLDEASGTRADSVADADLTDDSSVGSTTGKINDGANFVKSSSDSLSTTDTQTDITSDFSFSCWANFSTTTSGQLRPFFGKDGSASTRSYAAFFFNNSGTHQLKIFVSSTGSNNEELAVNISTLSTGTWYHIVGTWDASTSTAEFFVDGSSAGTATGSFTSIANTSATWYMGRFGNFSGDYTDAAQDEFALYSKVLGVDEVRALYGYGTPPVYDAGGGASVGYKNLLTLGAG